MNRRTMSGISLIGLVAVTAWFFWPRSKPEIQMESSAISEAVFEVSNTELKDRIDLLETVVVRFSFLPQVPWPDDGTVMLVLSIVPEGAGYSAAKTRQMLRRTSRSSVALDYLVQGQLRNFNAPAPDPQDPHCYYYTTLDQTEFPMTGPCRLEVMLLRTPAGKTNNYGRFSPMVPKCVFRRVVEIVH